MSDTRTNHVTGDNEFHQKHFHKILVALIVLIFVMIGLVILLLYQVHHRPLPPFSAVAQNGQRMVLTSSDQPNLLSSAVIKWAVRAATNSYTFDFTQTDGQVAQAVSPYFTKNGWIAYWQSLQKTLQVLRQNKLFVYCIVSAAPVISNQGELPGKGEVKRVQLPFLVTYESTEGTDTRPYMVILTIVGVPTTENPSAMAIDQFVMR